MNLWCPYDAVNIVDPYPMYRQLRQQDPLHKSHTGEWIVSTYEDVKAILKDNRFKAGNKKEWFERGINYLNNKGEDFSAISDAINSFVLLINPPEHTRIRRFIMQAWDDHAVESLITESVNELLSPLHKTKSFDAVKTFSSQLPALVIAEILGIPKSEYRRLRDAGRELIKVVNPYNSYKDLIAIKSASKEFIDFFKSLLQLKSKEPGNDLISRIVRLNNEQKKSLSDRELISVCIFLFIAGEETTISFLGTCLLNLGRHREKREELIHRPEIFDLAIEELLRFDGPVHLLGRIAHNDISYKNIQVKRNEVVTLCLASANRDPRQFDDPDTIKFDRSSNKHLAFGQGTHFCLGDWLAKKQTKIGLSEFLKAFPAYSVDDSEIKWSKNLSIRTLSALKIQM